MGATHSLHPTNHILMQSAITKISGAGKRYRQARILFDTPDHEELLLLKI